MATFDGAELVRSVQVTVHIPRAVFLRMRLATWLIALASILAPFSVDIRQDVKIRRIQCRKCDIEFDASLSIGTETVVGCPECRYQVLAEYYDGKVIFPGKSRFDCEDCGWAKPFGFVPCADCEFHD